LTRTSGWLAPGGGRSGGAWLGSGEIALEVADDSGSEDETGEFATWRGSVVAGSPLRSSWEPGMQADAAGAKPKVIAATTAMLRAVFAAARFEALDPRECIMTTGTDHGFRPERHPGRLARAG
jgi:hypothetical protein